jgi:non-heme chloroperoxidase
MQRRHALGSMVVAAGGGLLGVTRRAGTDTSGTRAVIHARDGTRLHVQDWGAGRPIVLLAPWALCSDWWDYHISTLAGPEWRCVAPDRRGHGRSDEPGRGYDFDTLADDIAQVMEQLDLRDVVLVGHSFGGAEAVRYLTRHQGRRVSRLVLIAPTTPFLLRTDDNPQGAPREAMERGRDNLKRNLHRTIAQAANAFFGPDNEVPQEVQDWWVRMMVDRCSLPVMLALNKAMTETDFRAELGSIAVPTLIVHGDKDASAKLELTSQRTHQLIPGSRLVIYAGAAHGISFTHADRLLAEIQAFAR